MSTTSIPRVDDIFQRANELPSLDVLQAFLPGAEVRHNKTSSPFTEDRNPSFHVYPNGFKDYSTGVYYDNVAFVAELLNLRPLAAAKLICEKFGIPIRDGPLSFQDKLKITRAKAEREREKRLNKAFNDWCKETGTKARVLAEAIRSVLDEKGVEVDEELLPMVHLLPWLEWAADVLNLGTDGEKIELYRNPELRRWFNWRI
jgi:hypothetical protein